jgi:alanine dehydrogenase
LQRGGKVSTSGIDPARVAAGLGANVVVMDINLNRLRYLDEIMTPMAQIRREKM